MKDPDGVWDSLDQAATASLAGMTGITSNELETLEDARRSEISEYIGRWVEYGEYITIEIDTDEATATVCKL